MAREKAHVNLMEGLPWYQKGYYLENVGKLPEEFPEGSEGHIQFTYNPRTKVSREYMKGIKKELEECQEKTEQSSLF